jgi:UDP-N-acetylmuramate--alanine ligase
LAPADHIVLADIYSAGEDPIEGVTIDVLAEAVRREAGRPVEIARRVEDVAPLLASLARPGDVVLTLGAGSIGSVAAKLVDMLEKPKGVRA